MNRTSNKYLVVGAKPWNRRVFDDIVSKYPGHWEFIGSKDELSLEKVKLHEPRYIFFLHWSWKVPAKIIQEFECVCFHMTDVPFGRGGSPLQNLILLGRRETKLTALKMTESFDAGPVYLKTALSLEGSAEEILIRAGIQSAAMIATIISEQPTPVPQEGEPTIFKRRKAEESEIPYRDSIIHLHDFIRMLDGDGYPPAFLIHQGFRYEFSRAVQYDGKIVADVTITPEIAGAIQSADTKTKPDDTK